MPIVHSTFRACLLAGAASLMLAACGEEDSTPNTGSGVTTSTAAQIARESAADYAANLNGLVSGSTLKRWIGNWEAQRPAGITGDLIILQASEGPAGHRFIRPNNVNVLTFVEPGWFATRSNGVTEIATAGLAGLELDQLLVRYGIDVSRDLIVCAQGDATPESFAVQAWCWHTLRYWGVEHDHIAVLNGGNAHLGAEWTAADFSAADFIPALPGQPSPTNAIRGRTVVSVKSLRTDNTVLRATLEDVIDELPALDVNEPGDGVFLWDARTLEEFSAGEATEAALPAVVALADRYASIRNGAPRQGHPRGAVNLAWHHLLDTATGLYKSRAELSAFLAGGIEAGTRGFVSAQYQFLGEGNAYRTGDTIHVWSETAAQAAIPQFTAAAILGLPARLYEGGTIEWNSLTGGALDRDGTPVLPADSPWRTDLVSSGGLTNLAGQIDARNAWSNPSSPKVTVATAVQPRILGPTAADSLAAVKLDRAYIRSDDDGAPPPDDGGGPLLPPNPCGG